MYTNQVSDDVDESILLMVLFKTASLKGLNKK
jgi:hypothetical protein